MIDVDNSLGRAQNFALCKGNLRLILKWVSTNFRLCAKYLRVSTRLPRVAEVMVDPYWRLVIIVADWLIDRSFSRFC